MVEYKGMLVICELEDNTISRATRESLGIGRKLADELGVELRALVLGTQLEDVGKKIVTFGADKVYIVDHPLIGEYYSDVYVEVITKVCQQLNPSIVLLAQTNFGYDLAPRISFRLGGQISTGCTELNIDPESKLLMQTRPVFGGNANAVMVTKGIYPQIVTIRPRSAPAAEPDEARHGEVIGLDIQIDESVKSYKIIRRIKEEAAGIKLENAKIVVAGGRGLGDNNGFGLLWELANLLGGTVGATMPPCKYGWISPDLEIGQTGKIIASDIYITVAISGAPQHIAGCLGAKIIVAVNSDPEANIFKVADYGVVGNYKEVLPVFIEKVKELRQR